MLHIFMCDAGAASKILKVEITGNSHVSTEKILRVLRINIGGEYNEDEFKLALKRLFATKEFSDVSGYKTPAGSNVSLEIAVKEYLTVNEVRFEGLDHISEEDALKEIAMKKGSFMRPSMVSADKDAIIALYKDKGYFRAAADDSLAREKNENILIYKIVPGNKVSIKHIDFFGNGALNSDRIKGVMKSKEDRWWRGAEFKPKVLEEDDESIINIYRQNGFLDAAITDKELVFSENGKDLDIFITVDEGLQYKVGKIAWHGNTIIKDKEIKPYVILSEGNVFNEAAFTDIQLAISTLYWDRGYIYNSVTPIKKLRDRIVDSDLEIFEGTPAHIKEIKIEGNTKTSERVIRRELVVSPGDVFLRPRLVRSLREVFNLGFFEGPPDVNPTPANEEGDVDITIKVKEKQTGQFRLGAGFSELNSVSGFFGITEPNFLGRGQRVGIDWEFSKYRQNIDLRFTEPWLMGTPTELSVNLYNTVQNRVSQQFYDDRRKGFSIRLVRPFPWFDYTTIYGRYRFESVELMNFSLGYTGPLVDIHWPQKTSSTAITLARNSTDSPFHPSTGTSSLFTAEWNGGALGGDADFQKYEAAFSWYTPLFWKFVLEMKFQTGILDGYKRPSQVPDYELFRLGGNRRYGVRGYDYYEIIPDGNPEFIGGRYIASFCLTRHLMNSHLQYMHFCSSTAEIRGTAFAERICSI